MKSRTEILVPLAAIQAVPIAVIAWYRLHRYAWYRYSAIVTLQAKAVREAVTNMVIHSDFMVNGVLKVEKFDDSFVLTNPGLLK